MMQITAFAIYEELQALDLLKDSPRYWWPNAGTFEVVIGAILTQNTTWSNVEKSLHNLEGFLDLEHFVQLTEADLKVKIKPSGFYNQKAPRLLQIAHNIQEEFGDFQRFQKAVSREWLLQQKGIGQESADAILCYGCFRAEMVVDSYTKRLLKKYAIEFRSYQAYKKFLQEGLAKHIPKEELFEHFAAFHAMIVEYNKKYKGA